MAAILEAVKVVSGIKHEVDIPIVTVYLFTNSKLVYRPLRSVSLNVQRGACDNFVFHAGIHRY